MTAPKLPKVRFSAAAYFSSSIRSAWLTLTLTWIFHSQLMHHDGFYLKQKANPDRRVFYAPIRVNESISQNVGWWRCSV